MYMRMTKVVENEGREYVACSLLNTERCLIHKCGGCGSCEVFSGILNQLYAFEDAYCEVESEDSAS